MLVCNVSQAARRAAITADIAEAAAASDSATQGPQGQVVFAALVDDPANVRDLVNASLGQIMVEAASAASVVGAGFALAAAVVEAATASETDNATITSAPAGTTWNPSDKAASVTLSNGNLSAASGVDFTVGNVRGTKSISSGKAYFEVTPAGNNNTDTMIGVANATKGLTIGSGANSAWADIFGGQCYINSTSSSTNLPPGVLPSGSAICVALDMTNKRLWLRMGNNNWNNNSSANPATNVGGFDVSAFLTGAAYPILSVLRPDPTCVANFGASAFSQTVPSGFVSWNSA